MNSIKSKFKIIVYSILLMFLFEGCKTYSFMPFHETVKLDNFKNISSYNSIPDFKKLEIILKLNEDLSLQPVGAMIINDEPVLTYVLRNPGFIIYDKIFAQLKKNNAVVYRLYNDKYIREKDILIVNISLKHLEIHNINNFKFVSRCILSYKLKQKKKKSKVVTVDIKSNGKDTENLMNNFAIQFSNNLYTTVSSF